MKRIFSLALVIALCGGILAHAAGVGNPKPGYPHDTIIIHVAKDTELAKDCDGGHSLFLRYSELNNSVWPIPTY